MIAIEADNKSLKGVLPKNYANPELDKRVLGNVVDVFTNMDMSDTEASKDLLGRTYEYCIAQFASYEGVKGGEFYTPASVVKTIVNILKPSEGKRVYDPCCGSGGMFVQSVKFIQEHAGNRSNISVFGQEANADTWKMAKMNMAIRGIDANFGDHPEDTFFNDLSVTIPVTLWFITRGKKQTGKTLFIDARNMGHMVDRKHRDFSEEDITRLANTFTAFQNGTLEDVKGFCAVATTKQIAAQDYILTPGRYVGIEEKNEDDEPFADKMTRLTTELGGMFAKSHELEEEIKKNLAGIGFKI